MVRDLFGVEPDIWQADGLRAFADPTRPRIAMQACAGPGKSTELSWFGWNFLLCYADKGQHPNGVAVSMTGDNLKTGLWKELALWREKSPLLKAAFEMTSSRIYLREFPQTWFIDAKSWPKTANPDEAGRTLSGLHSPFILYLCDESGDIPPQVGRAMEQGLSNCRWGKIATAGNPTSHEGLLYDIATKQAHLWYIIRITGDPDDSSRSARIPMAWAREQIALHGRDNAWVMAYILGKFPPTSLNALLGPDDVAAAMKRHLRPDEYAFSQKRIGIDVARFGDDETVFFPRQGLAAYKPKRFRGLNGIQIAGQLASSKNRWGSELELIDDTGGYGASTIDQARLISIPIFPVNFAGSADDPRYLNKRAEMHFRAAEWVKHGGALPNDPEVARQAVAPRYWFNKGKLQVEEKEQIKARIGRSPDDWDAFVVTFALPDMPTQQGDRGRIAQLEAAMEEVGGGRMLSDWDPLDWQR